MKILGDNYLDKQRYFAFPASITTAILAFHTLMLDIYD